jgi:predicted GIY-YIG superfamily endonuclease
MNPIHDSEHALYRFFDDQGALLYIGLTVNLPTRLRDHHHGKAWWQSVARMTVQRYPTRAEVVEAERLAIIAERPIHNVQHNRPKKGANPVGAAEQEDVIFSNEFVGSFFHSDVTRGWQGKVIESLGGGFYFVVTFSWMSGDEWTRHVVSLSEMGAWRFYSSDEAMIRAAPSVSKVWERERGQVSDMTNEQLIEALKASAPKSTGR